MANVTRELQATLEIHPTIENVYFDINGNHHFNVFPAQAKDPKTGKVISTGGFMAGGNGGTIVKTMTRNEVLGIADAPKEPVKKLK